MTGRRVQLTTDGSHDPVTRLGAWGAVITVLDDGRHHAGSGIIAGRCGSSNSCEAKAMAAALMWALEAGYIGAGDSLVLVTDCGRLHAELSGKRISARNRRRIRRGQLVPAQDTGLDQGSGRKVMTAALAAHGIAIEAVVQVKGHPSHAERQADPRLETMHKAHRLSHTTMRGARVNAPYGPGDAHLVAR